MSKDRGFRRWNLVKKIVKVGYMCATDYNCELNPDVIDGIPVFSTIKALKKKRKCVEECGIVKVKIVLDSVVQEPNFPKVGKCEAKEWEPED